MVSLTLADAIRITGKDVLDYLDRDVSVPVVTKAACQGDVSFLRSEDAPATTPMPKQGVVIVRSEASANTHSLHPDGSVFWDYRSDGSLLLGVLTVPEGSSALVSHQEHGALQITPGTYRVGRQREWQGEWALVRD